MTKNEENIILIVDDEIPITEILADFITELNFRPLIAHNGQQALTLARECWPVLVITDFMMPVLNGADLIRSLHAEAHSLQRPYPAVILLSAISPKLASDLQVSVVLPKPFDLDELEEIIHRLLKR